MVGVTNSTESEIIFTKVSERSGGDGSYSSWIPFNTIISNIGGGTWDNGQYIVPKDGIYLAMFTNYSNNQGAGRTALAHLKADKTQIEMDMVNSNYSASISALYDCKKGERIVAGAYASSYVISVYRADGHNEFTILKIK